MFIDYYKILQTPRDSDLSSIKLAYRKQVKIWHPDRNKSKDSTEKMQLINEAFFVLKDEKLKKEYDIEYDICTRQSKLIVNKDDCVCDKNYIYKNKKLENIIARIRFSIWKEKENFQEGFREEINSGLSIHGIVATIVIFLVLYYIF